MQLQIQDVLRQQAEAHKKQNAQKKRMGVDVTRFQKTARGQYVIPGGGARGIHIANLNIHGIRNVAELENELARRSKQRPRSAEDAIAPPTARFQLAFAEPDPAAGELRWQPEPDWTDMDDELRIAEYSIDRGR